MSIDSNAASPPAREISRRGLQHSTSGITCKNHHRYSLTCLELEELWNRCGGACEACGRVPRVPCRGLVIDHDHRYGFAAVRGLICHRCNHLLGRIEQPEISPPFGRTGPGRHFAIYLHNAWFAGNATAELRNTLDYQAVLEEVSEWRKVNTQIFNREPNVMLVPRDKPVVIARALRDELSPQAFAALIRVMEGMASVPKRLPS